MKHLFSNMGRLARSTATLSMILAVSLSMGCDSSMSPERRADDMEQRIPLNALTGADMQGRPECVADVAKFDSWCSATQWDNYCTSCGLGEPGYGGLDCSGIGDGCQESVPAAEPAIEDCLRWKSMNMQGETSKCETMPVGTYIKATDGLFRCGKGYATQEVDLQHGNHAQWGVNPKFVHEGPEGPQPAEKLFDATSLDEVCGAKIVKWLGTLDENGRRLSYGSTGEQLSGTRTGVYVDLGHSGYYYVQNKRIFPVKAYAMGWHKIPKIADNSTGGPSWVDGKNVAYDQVNANGMINSFPRIPWLTLASDEPVYAELLAEGIELGGTICGNLPCKLPTTHERAGLQVQGMGYRVESGYEHGVTTTGYCAENVGSKCTSEIPAGPVKLDEALAEQLCTFMNKNFDPNNASALVHVCRPTSIGPFETLDGQKICFTSPAAADLDDNVAKNAQWDTREACVRHFTFDQWMVYQQKGFNAPLAYGLTRTGNARGTGVPLNVPLNRVCDGIVCGAEGCVFAGYSDACTAWNDSTTPEMKQCASMGLGEPLDQRGNLPAGTLVKGFGTLGVCTDFEIPACPSATPYGPYVSGPQSLICFNDKAHDEMKQAAAASGLATTPNVYVATRPMATWKAYNEGELHFMTWGHGTPYKVLADTNELAKCGPTLAGPSMRSLASLDLMKTDYMERVKVSKYGGAQTAYREELRDNNVVTYLNSEQGCPAGTFQDTQFHSCVQCPTGTYTGSGSVGPLSCIPCAAGTYAPNPGTVVCTTCQDQTELDLFVNGKKASMLKIHETTGQVFGATQCMSVIVEKIVESTKCDWYAFWESCWLESVVDSVASGINSIGDGLVTAANWTAQAFEDAGTAVVETATDVAYVVADAAVAAANAVAQFVAGMAKKIFTKACEIVIGKGAAKAATKKICPKLCVKTAAMTYATGGGSPAAIAAAVTTGSLCAPLCIKVITTIADKVVGPNLCGAIADEMF